MIRNLSILLAILSLVPAALWAAKLAEVKVVDQDYLMVHALDGIVELVEDLDRIPKPFTNIDSDHKEADRITRYDPALDVAAAQQAAHWILRSEEDDTYGTDGKAVSVVTRRKKLNGMAIREWTGSDFRYDTTFEHHLFLRLPHSLKQGASYVLVIDPSVNLDTAAVPFTFDYMRSRTEAIKVNLAGYWSEDAIKPADLYQWLGDGGARDYSAFEGNKVFLFNVETEEATEVGAVSFWKDSSTDAGGWNYTRSPVWSIDFTGFHAPGSYRLAVEGVGCSEDFDIRRLPRKAPFDVVVQGYYFMRTGEPDVDGVVPVPRQPRFIPGVDPADCKVYLTSMHPYHPEWRSFSSGDAWDKPNDWARFRLAGEPTNPNAVGGHSDALDWDRHLAHVSNIYDMLLPYLLTGGILSDDNTGIAESGNGIPDLLDSARYEVDFFLSLKTEHGYGHGVTNPTKGNVLYQAGPTAIAAWANAANAAMLADAFRVARQKELMGAYCDAAETAFHFASALEDPMLDAVQEIGWMNARGRDFKMMAAAFLYNVTGNADYEAVIAAESVVREGSATDLSTHSHEQIYASAAYLITPQTVRHESLREHMRAAIIREARAKEAGQAAWRPSRRAAFNDPCWFQSAQHMHRTILAHHVATEPSDKRDLLNALILEASWGLGRNPANMIQMTTATTKLAGKRSVELCYTSGQFDGVPGLHPGHTPYMNIDDWWADGMIMFRPTWMANQSFPAWSQWPHAEAHFNTRHVFANGEFTPRQTMRGKLALYAYLLALEKRAAPLEAAFIHLRHNSEGLRLRVDAPSDYAVYRLQRSPDLRSWENTAKEVTGAACNVEWILADTLPGATFWRILATR